MKTAIRYYSRSGNTKKLAEAVAAGAGGKALSVSENLDGHVDVLFLGSSVYAGTFHPSVKEFIVKNAKNIGSIAVFGSSASGSTNFKKIKDVAESLGIKMNNKQFFCNARFLFLHKGRPNEDDLAAAESFAHKIAAGGN